MADHPLRTVRPSDYILDNSNACGAQRVILLVLALCADSGGVGTLPEVEVLARRARISPAEALECIRQLERSGELVNLGGRRFRLAVAQVVDG